MSAALGERREGNCGERHKLAQLIRKYKHIFDDKPGRTTMYVAQIPVKNDTPFRQATYPIPHAVRGEVERQLNDMIRDGVIERASSAFVNPLVCVCKPSGEVRLCLDARRLNKEIVPERESPADPEGIFTKFRGAKYLSTTDFAKGFWQVPLREEHRDFTAFLFNGKSYRFKVLPFGLSNSVGEFCRAVDTSLGPEVGSYVGVYVDDLVIASRGFEEHMEHLEGLFRRVQEVGMKLKLRKSYFLRESVPFLGYILSAEGIGSDPSKVQAIVDFPKPRNVRELRASLGCVGFIDVLPSAFLK